MSELWRTLFFQFFSHFHVLKFSLWFHFSHFSFFPFYMLHVFHIFHIFTFFATSHLHFFPSSLTLLLLLLLFVLALVLVPLTCAIDLCH